ncbi:hypothetical protein EXIGLDRAFT_87097 [Exidia glandulosa HHB12029]|uniref:Uncharacterized protein n=1 Tax=Exidia glandulosa HHB12029 TaxID=1314781 RepID=A0A165HD15_EXIGL|nr:hypothetical protein EXIGLDRAFT_87097 [Exidia glandulosa HHB12029]
MTATAASTELTDSLSAHLLLRLAPHRIQSRKLSPGRPVSDNLVLQPPSTCILGALFVHERLVRPSLDNMLPVCAGAYSAHCRLDLCHHWQALVAASLTTMRASYSSPVKAHLWAFSHPVFAARTSYSILELAGP